MVGFHPQVGPIYVRRCGGRPLGDERAYRRPQDRYASIRHPLPMLFIHLYFHSETIEQNKAGETNMTESPRVS